MESGNIPMAPRPPPPPLPNSAPPPSVSNGSTHPHRSQNGDHSERQELMSEIREGVILKASRDQILSLSRTPNGGIGSGDSIGVAESVEAEDRLKKTVNSELQHKFDEIDSSVSVQPSKINPDAPGAPPPLHIPMSTAIRVLQERERKESEMNQMKSVPIRPTTPTATMTTTTPPQSRNGTLTRDGTMSGDKLMISHGKRNFTINANGSSGTPKKITIKNEKLVPKRNLLGGEGKMSSDLKKLLATDAENVVEPPPQPSLPPTPLPAVQIKSPQLQQTNGDPFRQKHLRSPEAIEISRTLKQLISQDSVDAVQQQQPLRVEVSLPADHKVSDQLKKLLLEDINNTAESPSQTSSITAIHHEKRSPIQAKPIKKHPISNPISPSVKNGSLIDNTIRIPLPPRVPSPPPQENPKRLDTQLSCDRLNKEFQEFNAYRVVSPPSPKKFSIPLDPNGAPNFEKKTVVSFAKELAAPNRYPDTVKVTKTVQNGNNGEMIQQLGMVNIKFVIDPERSNGDIDVQVSM